MLETYIQEGPICTSNSRVREEKRVRVITDQTSYDEHLGLGPLNNSTERDKVGGGLFVAVVT